MEHPALAISFVVLILLIAITLGMWGCPQWSVYSQKMEGEGILAHAQSSREVAVAEARAKMESASLLAQADTIRAHGVARSSVTH
jgi:predicted aminopeptidase